MLLELRIKDLGVIDEASILFGPGMTAVTGETGAGKTMIVGAIGLLMGARADGTMVRVGAAEASVEGRFVDGDTEVVLRRVIPRQGRSRAYVDGGLATATELTARGAHLVDLHGQHAHQSLLSAAAQRDSLDRYGQIDVTALVAARDEVARIDAELAALGGDERARAREIDLCRYQRDEIEAAAITGPDEDELLEAREALLADAEAHRTAGGAALEVLGGEGGVVDELGRVLHLLDQRSPYADEIARLGSLLAEVDDVRASLRDVAEAIDDDPEALASVQARRAELRDLSRKYGDRLADVMAFHAETTARLAELESFEQRAASLDHERSAAMARLAVEQAAVRAARVEAAPRLAAAVGALLAELAMPHAEIEIAVEGEAGEQVAFLLSANRGAEALPLARTASGGELARVMLALRVVSTQAPPTLVFDEVDAGVGGAAAHAVGRSLAALGVGHQVLVVTHLAQVAAVAAHQLLVTKHDGDGSTATTVRSLEADERVTEISRMLSGRPDSDAAREHAAELLGSGSRPSS